MKLALKLMVTNDFLTQKKADFNSKNVNQLDYSIGLLNVINEIIC